MRTCWPASGTSHGAEVLRLMSGPEPLRIRSRWRRKIQVAPQALCPLQHLLSCGSDPPNPHLAIPQPPPPHPKTKHLVQTSLGRCARNAGLCDAPGCIVGTLRPHLTNRKQSL